MNARPIPIQWTPDLPIYATEGFLKSVGTEFGWLGGFDRSDTLRCILPYTIVQKAIFRMVRFRVETIPVSGPLSVKEEKQFLNSAIEQLRRLGADMIIPASTNAIFHTFPDGADAAPYGTYVIDLRQDEEALFSKLNTSHRRKVRLATKAGVTIRSGLEHADAVYELVRDTFKRSAMGFMSRASFESFIRGLQENVKVFIAELNGAVQGGMVVPFSKHTAYYVYGGSVQEPAAGAMNLLHWEAIRQFRQLGVKRYDFVGVRINPEKGSKQEGLLQFKQRFGGQLVEGYIWKYSFSPLKYWVYNSAVGLLRHGDIVDQERHKIKMQGAAREHIQQSDPEEKEQAIALLGDNGNNSP